MKRRIILIIFFALLSVQNIALFAQQRFPKPEFEQGHQQPPTQTPEVRSEVLEYLDVFVLLAALSLMTWFVIRKRSRKGVFWLSVFSLLYFGFFREGCVCSIGSIQNIVLALFHPEYSIPITVIAFFVLPIIFTLFYGRTFCAGVCPLGAIQDLVAFRPQKLQTWLKKLLGIIPFLYLGLSILYAATETDFIICRYDPFVGFFRFDAKFSMLMVGGIFLIAGVFIARPYCRFFCPYGVILNLVSRVSRKHLTITPAACIQCKLCESSCPYDAIDAPVNEKALENRTTVIRRYIIIGLIIPLLIFIGGWTGSQFHENLAKVNKTVQLAQEVLELEKVQPLEDTFEIEAFKSAGRSKEDLFLEAKEIMKDFYIGSWILGGFIGLVFGLTLLSLSKFRYKEDYSPDKGNCLSCARCVDYCPVPAEE